MTMHVLLSNRIRTKRNNILKSNHSWTVWEIMTLYAFVSTVKYTKEYWMSATYKITNKSSLFNTSHCLLHVSFSKAENWRRFFMSHWVYNCEKNTECYNFLVQMQKITIYIFLISSSSSSKNSSNILWADNPIHVATYCEENVWGWRQRVARQCR